MVCFTFMFSSECKSVLLLFTEIVLILVFWSFLIQNLQQNVIVIECNRCVFLYHPFLFALPISSVSCRYFSTLLLTDITLVAFACYIRILTRVLHKLSGIHFLAG